MCIAASSSSDWIRCGRKMSGSGPFFNTRHNQRFLLSRKARFRRSRRHGLRRRKPADF
jgi:hypothetical protein